MLDDKNRIWREADMSIFRFRYLLAVRLLAVGGIAGLGTACENYSTPDLDEQGRLNEAYQRGAISKSEYERSLKSHRTEAWGSTGEAPPRHHQYSF